MKLNYQNEEGDRTMKAAPLKIIAVSVIASVLFLTATNVMGQSVIDLSVDQIEQSIISTDGNDHLGSANALALGDFNDDGAIDYLLGAPGGDGPNDNRVDAGEVYVLLGEMSSDPERAIDELASLDIVVFGREAGDGYGSGVAACDINGDGFDDMVMGAPGGRGRNNSRTDAGEVAIIYGGPNLPASIDLSDYDPDILVYGTSQNSRFGEGLLCFDFNADGLGDIVFADPLGGGGTNGKSRSGNVFVLFGAQNLPSSLDITSPTRGANVSIFGSESQDQMGTSMAVGDINNDGIFDLILGAPFADGPRGSRPSGGEVYVFYGRREFPRIIDVGITSPSLTLFSASAQDQLGTAVSSGDVNGDGISDLVAGAPFSAGPNDLRGFSGEVLIVYGSNSLSAVIDPNTNAIDVMIYGANSLENLGASVEVADLNNDGVFDLMLGATGGRAANGTRAGAGKVYAFGSSGNLDPIIDLAEFQVDLIVIGSSTGDNLGSALLGGSLTIGGEGVILIGADGVDSPADGPDAGAVYVLPARDFISPGNGNGDDCPPNYPLGDVNQDCSVTIIDAKLICESVLGLRELTEAQIELADVAAPFGQITLADAIRVAEAAVGLVDLEEDSDDEDESASATNSQGSTAHNSIEPLNVNHWRVSSTGNHVEASAVGTGVTAVQLEVFDLRGTHAYNSGWSDGTRALWNTQIGPNRPANGVYLYVLRARGADGQVVMSEIRKIVILR